MKKNNHFLVVLFIQLRYYIFMINKKQINKAIVHTGLTVEGLFKDECYYFIDSMGSQVGEPVLVARLNQIPIETWVKYAEEAKNLTLFS